MEKIKITSEFKQELQNLKCSTDSEYISPTRIEDNKLFFTYGSCKLHIPYDDVEKIKD
jgi:hypothetical protein